MPDQAPISLSVKLGYWDVYRLNVVLTATVFRKLLYIWGFVALLWLAFSVLLLLRPAPEQDWAVIMQNASPLEWVLSLPVLFVFVVPLLSARRVLRDERVKQGVSYQFSDAGIHVKTSVSRTDLSWVAIRRVSESRSAFLIFTNPNIASMVPKRCIESTQVVADLRELFRARVPKTKLRRD
jgi:hypothetical protein